MKTYEEFRLMVMEFDFPLPVSHAKIEELAAKEYAKQWIEVASKVGKEYPYGEAITESILDVKKRIDAQ